MDHGIVGGSLKDQLAQTQAVGRLALRVLAAKRADSIPPVPDDLNVDAGRLAPAAALGHQRVARARRHGRAFSEPSVWDRFAPYFVARRRCCRADRR